MNSNIGYLYYRKYFTDEYINKCKVENEEYEKEENPVIKINKEILNGSNIDVLKNNKFEFMKEIQDKLYTEKIYFKITYPGLIIGTGYSHILKEKEEFKLGLEFDYTTGLPVINGSSVKGVLRNVFYNEKDDEKLIKEKKSYIEDTLKEVMKKENIEFNEEFHFEELTNNIFDGKFKENDENYICMPMNKRDIFLGATIDIDATAKQMENVKGKNLLGEDYITPHGKEKDKFKEPNPIKFLKVMPNVVWCFGFNLKKFNDEITSEVKKKLFKQILLDVGIGAKTNVGYGRLEFIKY
ncbi:type III-B CRISPR module RAMP protein Cmr6 [Clostridium sp. Marseille-Q2269]|uniref:type III-B CRISPR module RAMP protein Cmr6 n=1 Tax=Clostridium sp. Marseille-Q2269 TaxID=2942205 RepID=UPI00207306FB|nr:type III-B CRISPR module RAMP protein Cmr6 [Clostridium sp. Marseille-Q2269]